MYGPVWVGKDEEPYSASISLDGIWYGSGTGSTKKQAKQEAGGCAQECTVWLRVQVCVKSCHVQSSEDSFCVMYVAEAVLDLLFDGVLKKQEVVATTLAEVH